jgi:hypothetical protein
MRRLVGDVDKQAPTGSAVSYAHRGSLPALEWRLRVGICPVIPLKYCKQLYLKRIMEIG